MLLRHMSSQFVLIAVAWYAISNVSQEILFDQECISIPQLLSLTLNFSFNLEEIKDFLEIPGVGLYILNFC